MANNLYNTMYNPDVLSCIANLSNDEVFTPPEVAMTLRARAEYFYGKLQKGSSRASSRCTRICRSARIIFLSISFMALPLRS